MDFKDTSPPPPPYKYSPHNCANSFLKKRSRAWEVTASKMHFGPSDSDSIFIVTTKIPHAHPKLQIIVIYAFVRFNTKYKSKQTSNVFLAL